MYDGDTFTIDAAPGHTFRVHIKQDDRNDPPWEQADGHGPMREVYNYYGRPEKRPGEVVLSSHRGNHWLYDRQAATAEAIRDGWGVNDAKAEELRRKYRMPNTHTKRGIATLAVLADMEFLAGWLNNDWTYVGVCVQLLDDDGNAITDEYDFALWGIESCAEDYIEEVAHDLALQCAQSEGITTEQRKDAWRTALREARERRYWAQRDVVTA